MKMKTKDKKPAKKGFDKRQGDQKRRGSKRASNNEEKGRRATRSGRLLTPTRQEIERRIKALFDEHANKVLNYKQVCYLFGQTTMAQKRAVVAVLEELVIRGWLEEVEMGRYRLSRKAIGEEGVFSFRGKSASFIPEGSAEVFPVSEQGMGLAMNGDRVRVRQTRGGHVEVVEVLERSKKPYVGKIERYRGASFFVSESRELRQDVFIAFEDLSGASNGDRVVVLVDGWLPRAKNPHGHVVDVLGKAGDNDVEMHAILAEYGLPYTYPEVVEKAAEALSGEITEEALEEREDFRGVLTFTIDPRDAKDFDDALSLRELGEDLWEVGVHIADVSHFVRPGDLIDEEAYARATSVYLVDRTIPMLPERLSNGLCSLRPGEEKYSYSCIFSIDGEGEVQGSRIVRTVILSDRRYTYEEAQSIIDGEADEYAEAILRLNDMAQKMRARRFAAGAISFEREEVRFEIDEEGRPLSVYLKESLPAHQLIEEFMLLANRTVAETIARAGEPAPTFVYRVHDLPDDDKLQRLSEFVGSMGYKLKTGGGQRAIGKSLNELLHAVKGKPEDNVVSTIAIRTMSKAKYTTENIGHYGLAFDDYTHFTSPIRRYPDLMVHRLLTRYLSEGGGSVDQPTCEAQCEHASKMEQLASQAERASIRYKQVEYMSRFLGERFEGVISGVAEWGIYVELSDSKCEGLVPMRDLSGDYYEYDEKHYRLVGRHTGKTYTIGEAVEVVVTTANLERRILDFSLVE